MPPDAIGDPLKLLTLRSSSSSLNWSNVDTSQLGLATRFTGEIGELCRPIPVYL